MPKEEEEKPLQAVIIADSFNTRFDPISWELPRALFPLVNVPLIDYTLELLSTANIQEVFIFVRAHSDKVRLHVQNSKYSSAFPLIQIVESQDAASLGDALREFDSKGLISGDFVLLWGDSVSNMNLGAAIDEHKKRRESNRKAIATLVLKEAHPFHPSRERCEGAVFLINPNTQRILSYSPIESEISANSIELPLESLVDPKTSLRFDLMHGGIEICSPEVLALFTENFDYQSFGADFLRGVLTSEILDSQIYCKILSDEYAARVGNTHLYDSVSQDILRRWTYPVVPDVGLFDCDAHYTLGRNNVYIAQNLTQSRSAILKDHVVIGKNCSIGANTIIAGSVLGDNVKIGDNVFIEGSYIWSDCSVDDDCRIIKSILANGCTIKSNSSINCGSLISFNAVIGPNASVPEFTRVTTCRQTIPDLSELSLKDVRGRRPSFSAPNKDILGSDSNAYIYDSTGDDMSQELRNACQIGHPYHSLRPDLVSALAAGDFTESEFDSEFEENSNSFAREAYDMMKHAIVSNYSIENALLELNSLKFACNATFKDMRSIIIIAILEAIDPSNVALSLSKHFSKWALLLGKISGAPHEQLEVLSGISDYLSASSLKYMYPILGILYKLEVVDGEAILSWYGRLECGDMREHVQPFIDWLNESDEDSAEDDTDEEDSYESDE